MGRNTKKAFTIVLPKRDVSKMIRVGVIPTKTILDKKTKDQYNRKPKHRKKALENLDF